MRNLSFLFIAFLLFQITTPAQVVVNAGWNLIGAISTIQASEVTTNPPGIIVSSFYGFNTQTGYNIATTLEGGKGYWVKVSSDGMINGFEPIFVCGVSKVEYEYKYYSTVQIGTQCWLKENLDIGTMILGINSQQNNSIVEKYCYSDNPTNCQLYGGLYQWDEAMQYVTTEGAQGICPTGWHLPTLQEFLTLNTSVGGDGNALKAVGQGSGGGAGTNTSGFSALLAGCRAMNGTFNSLYSYANIWSSTENGPLYAHFLLLYYSDNSMYLDVSPEEYGFSVRCLKD